jgi:hypothetical protein
VAWLALLELETKPAIDRHDLQKSFLNSATPGGACSRLLQSKTGARDWSKLVHEKVGSLSLRSIFAMSARRSWKSEPAERSKHEVNDFYLAKYRNT